jgi:hypothetical protein
VFGALGALWRRRGYSTLGAVAAILLLDAEPLFWMAAHSTGGVASFNFEPALVVSVGEALVGLAACMCVAVTSAAPRGAPCCHPVSRKNGTRHRVNLAKHQVPDPAGINRVRRRPARRSHSQSTPPTMAQRRDSIGPFYWCAGKTGRQTRCAPANRT